MPSMAASAGPPASHKKDKVEKLAGSSTTRRIDASITLMVDSMSTNSNKTHRSSNASWKEMMETQQYKLKLEREKVKASKLEA
jgi:hypothetical protein